MSIQKKEVRDLFLSTKVVTDVTEYSSGDGVTVDNAENKISADYSAISARLNSLPDPFPLSSQVISQVSSETARAKAAENALSDAIDSKIYIDGISAEQLSAIHVDDETYYQKVIDGTVKADELYILSSAEDCINCFDQRVANVADAAEEHDAVSKAFMENYVSSKYENIYDYVIEHLLSQTDESLKSRFKTWIGI